MKKKSILMNVLAITGFALLFTLMPELYGEEGEDPVRVWSSPDLQELTNTLVQVYQEQHPGTEISILSPDLMKSDLRQEESIGIITKNYFSDYDCDMLWRLAIGRDILIPVMNPENPFRHEIEERGVSPEEFRRLFTNGDSKKWGMLLDNENESKINCWCLPDESTLGYIADFFNTEASNLKPNDVSDVNELLNKINKDKYALGFCKLGDILDVQTKELDSRVIPVPIDLNANNKVDYFEDIYSNIHELERGAWIGKFPKSLYTCIYAVSAYPPSEEEERAFMEWLLTDGQDYLLASGYSELVFSERKSKLQSLYAPPLPISIKGRETIKVVNILLVIIAILAGLTGLYFIFLRGLLPICWGRGVQADPDHNFISSINIHTLSYQFTHPNANKHADTYNDPNTNHHYNAD